MGKALSLMLREQICELRDKGICPKEISEQLSIPYNTVKTLCKRFKKEGMKGLQPNYSNCGRKVLAHVIGFKATVLEKRHNHESWGAPRIHVELKRSKDCTENQASQVSIRTIQRWYRSAGVNPPRQQTNKPSIGRSTAPHNIWEVDAKEHLTLLDGSPACYLTIADEFTGAWLEATVFPLWQNISGATNRGARCSM
jgi:transposase